TEKLRIGVVTAIVAIWQYAIMVTGEQNHAGTTSMARRRDAGLALLRLLSAIDQRFPQLAGPRTVWTTGGITLEPGSHSIIPGRAESLFQLRDADPAVLDRMHAELFRLVDEANRTSRCKLELTVVSQSTPARMDERLMAALDRAAERHAPGKHIRVPSSAGISHHWSENTSDEDLVLGAQVFADGIAEALRG